MRKVNVTVTLCWEVFGENSHQAAMDATHKALVALENDDPELLGPAYYNGYKEMSAKDGEP